MNFRQRFFGHLHTITKHKWLVFIHCCRAGIIRQGILHDLSKYSPTEFIPGVKYYLGDKSPNTAEREDLGFSKAWMHHKGRNKHHFEYWTDLRFDTKNYGPVPMPMRYVIEMFCDRVAACKVYMKDKYYDGSAFDYFDSRHSASKMHPETAAILEKLLVMLKEHGEAETFAYIRTIDLHEKRK